MAAVGGAGTADPSGDRSACEVAADMPTFSSAAPAQLTGQFITAARGSADAATGGRFIGITLAGFEAFIVAAGGRAALAGKTTAQVKHDCVLAQTAGDRAAYAARLPAVAVGPATCFVVHAYDGGFLNAVDALAAWEARKPADSGPFFYFFDVLTVSQHDQPANASLEVLQEQFGGDVRGAERTLLCLEWEADAHKTPLVLTRAWCVFELYTTLTAGADLDVVLPPGCDAEVDAAIAADMDAQAGRFCTVDAASCDAREVADKMHIFQTIRDGDGIDAGNERVTTAMRAWLIGAGRRVLETLLPASPTACRLMVSLASLLYAHAEVDEAETLCRGGVEGLRSALGDSHADTVSSIGKLAAMLVQQEKLGDAEPLYREALSTFRGALGDAHARTLEAMRELADVLTAREKLAEAAALCNEALAGQRSALDDDHPATLTSIATLARVLLRQGSPGEAMPLAQEAMAGRRRVLGDRHPHTLASISDAALVLQALGDVAESTLLCREALAGRRDVLGSSHAATLGSVFQLAGLLQAQGEVADAEPLYWEALYGRRLALGASHADTLTTATEVASLLRTRGRLGVAKELYVDTLERQRSTLGHYHPDTLATAWGLAAVLQEDGSLVLAEAFHREILTGRRYTLGARHADTRASVLALAAVLQRQGKQAEAAPLLREASEG